MKYGCLKTRQIILIGLIACSLCCVPSINIPYAEDKLSPLQISEVSIDKEVFNPSAGEQVRIQFRLSQPGEVTLQLYDGNQDLIAVLANKEKRESGMHTLTWDGKDQGGRVVPDEAYFFTIDAMQGLHRAVYDPRSVSGGMLHEIERVMILADTQQLEYQLPETGRVSLRAGLVDGPVLAVPVDWEPRVKGLRREKWDGMDQEKLISVREHPRYQIRATYYTLPDNTIITSGNSKLSYLQYKQTQGASGAPKAQESPHASGSVLRSPLFSKKIIYAKAPPLEVTFPGAAMDEKHILQLPRNFSVRADFPDPWKGPLHPQLYEIYFFLDGKFLIEFPNIHLPYEANLNLKDNDPGVHVLTVNIIDIGGQVGIKSTQVRLQ